MKQNNWKKLCLEDVLILVQYGTCLPTTSDGNVSVIGMKNISNGLITINDYAKIKMNDKEVEKFKLLKGDILLNRTNSYDLVGKVGIFKDESITTVFASYLVRFRCNTKIVFPEYLNNWLNSSNIQRMLRRLSTKAVSQANINPTIAKKLIPVLLPPLDEQRIIVDIFSLWDEAIEKAGRLIELKEKQLIHLTKKLIPQKKINRKEFRLGDIAEMQSGGTPLTSNLDYYNGDIPWVSISDMTLKGKYIFDTKNKITQKGLENSSARIFPSGTVLYAMYASIGECSIATVPLSTSQAILGIQPSNLLHNEFLYYYLLSMKNKVRTLGQQGTQSNLNAKMVKNFKFFIPPLDKQKNIANILNSVQLEINYLIENKKLFNKQKQGLMQKLLTGKWRVKIKEEKEDDEKF